MKMNFEISYVIRKYNSYVCDKGRKCETGLTPEQTFKNILLSLPKKIYETLECVCFIQDGYNYIITADFLRESNDDFYNACIMNKI